MMKRYNGGKYENRKTNIYLRGTQRLNPLRTKDREGGDDITDLKEARGPQLFKGQPGTNYSSDAST